MRSLEDPMLLPGEMNLPPPDGGIISAHSDINDAAYIVIDGLTTSIPCVQDGDDELVIDPTEYPDRTTWDYDNLTDYQANFCTTDQYGFKVPGLPRNSWPYIDNITGVNFTILGGSGDWRAEQCFGLLRRGKYGAYVPVSNHRTG